MLPYVDYYDTAILARMVCAVYVRFIFVIPFHFTTLLATLISHFFVNVKVNGSLYEYCLYGLPFHFLFVFCPVSDACPTVVMTHSVYSVIITRLITNVALFNHDNYLYYWLVYVHDHSFWIMDLGFLKLGSAIAHFSGCSRP